MLIINVQYYVVISWSSVSAYHHVHCSGRHHWFQTFDVAHGVVELLCVPLHNVYQ